MADRTAFRQLIARHDGVFSTSEASACEITSSALHRMVRSGLVTTAVRGVYRMSDRPVDARMRCRMSVLAAGSGAALVGGAAAWWHGLVTVEPTTVRVIAPRGRHAAPIDGAQVWHRDVDPRDLTVIDGLRVTGLPLTVLDAAVDIGVSVMDRALQRGSVTLMQLDETQRRNRGRRGSPRARAMVAAMSEGARSVAERQATALLRSAGISGWRCNHPTCGYVIDITFPDLKVAVEIDGFAFHSDPVAFQHDRRRHNTLIANGWIVVHFTWQDVTQRPQQVLAHIRAALTRASAA
ncbi:type IV toxin-antitoxin system AbiEi family antitoxin domain-containing protein [Gordonia soli]|nr:type IV toxin-antitoxin system AbiEi family antitoxin domain-containing protein [Gordonia soli]